MDEKILTVPQAQEIEKLTVNEVAILKRIAGELGVAMSQVSAVVSLVGEGCTIPFIARYRKERHGNLNEVQVRDIDHFFTSYKNIEERRIEIIKAIFKTGKLTDTLYTAITKSSTLTELEDLYAPFKKKKKTRGMIAIEKGLEGLADAMMEMNDADLEEEAKKYITAPSEEAPSTSAASSTESAKAPDKVAADSGESKKALDKTAAEGGENLNATSGAKARNSENTKVAEKVLADSGEGAKAPLATASGSGKKVKIVISTSANGGKKVKALNVTTAGSGENAKTASATASKATEDTKAFDKTSEETLQVKSVQEALQGAMDINAERVSQSIDNRTKIHELYLATGFVATKGIAKDGQKEEDAMNASIYKMYWDYKEPLKEIKPHRILAINRAEKEGALAVTIEVDVEAAIAAVQASYKINNHYYKDAIEDGVVRLLSPAVLREIRSTETDEADEHGIGIFSENLKNLLMTRPIKRSRVLGVDPGIRTGTKCAALDETGKYLGYFKIFQVQNPDEAYKLLVEAIDKYDIQIVAVGNGTGSQEVQELVAKVISENYADANVRYTVVDESGASVYSASEVATKEFPELDLTIRGAISMGRRLQDPLAELVKIDPKSIGVGLYQHDVNQKKLGETLDEVVESVVNTVGVNLNTASYMLLRYVSGINISTAKKITEFRDKVGKISSREALKEVPGLGPKAFEQCAGFLKIAESADPLDNTWVHPENYTVAREVLESVKNGGTIEKSTREELCKKYNIGEVTLTDIIEELKKPNRDPRNDYPEPIMQKGVTDFKDLKVGMKVKGTVRNVVDFGAFVDIGLHDTALLHISQMSDNFVKDVFDVIKVGDIKEFTIVELDENRKRISLSLKTNPFAQKDDGAQKERLTAKERADLKKADQKPLSVKGSKKVVVVKKGGDLDRKANNSHSRDRQLMGSDDGLRYNPFATLLK